MLPEIAHAESDTDLAAPNYVSFALFNISRDLGDYDEARRHAEEALQTTRERGERQYEGWAVSYLGIMSHRLGDYGRARDYYAQALRIQREVGNRRGEGVALARLALLAHHLTDDGSARDYAQQAYLVGQDAGDRVVQGLASLHLGHALAGLGHLDEAAEAYREVVALRRELGQDHLNYEPLSGLARVSLMSGHLPEAQAHVEEILGYLETEGLDKAQEPVHIYLTCYHVLRASDDPRAEDMLEEGYQFLQERAAKISDEGERRSYLENVAAHRELGSEYALVGGVGERTKDK